MQVSSILPASVTPWKMTLKWPLCDLSGKRWIFGIKQFKKTTIIGFQKAKIPLTQNGVKKGGFRILEIGFTKENVLELEQALVFI